MHISKGENERERKGMAANFLFAECIDIKLDEGVQLIYHFTSLHIQRELFVI